MQSLKTEFLPRALSGQQLRDDNRLVTASNSRPIVLQGCPTAVNEPVKSTFDLLARTDNEAANRILVPALESPFPAIRYAATAAILSRRSLSAHREVIARLHRMDERWRELFQKHRDRIAPALRDAVLGADRQMCLNGCQATAWLREYDVMPALLNALEDPERVNADLLGQALSELVQSLRQLAAPREYGTQDPQWIRRQMVAALENSVQRFARHRRREVLEAFLRLVYRDNVTLKQMLENPHHAAFVALVEILSRSPHGSIIGLVTSFLDDPQAPSAALSVAAKRTDCKFVQHLLRKFGREPSAIVAQNLKRMDAIAWVRSGGELLDQLDESAQHAAIRMIMASAASRTHALPLVEHLLLHGKPEGRRAAAESLAAFHGAEANQLALRALDDKDPGDPSPDLEPTPRTRHPGRIAPAAGSTRQPVSPGPLVRTREPRGIHLPTVPQRLRASHP